MTPRVMDMYNTRTPGYSPPTFQDGATQPYWQAGMLPTPLKQTPHTGTPSPTPHTSPSMTGIRRTLFLFFFLFSCAQAGAVDAPQPSGANDHAVSIPEHTTEKPNRPEQATDLVLATAISPDGQQMATATYRTIYIWDQDNKKLHHFWQASDTWIRTLAFSPDGHILASAGNDGILTLWDWETAKALHTLKGDGGSVYAIAFSPEGTTLASGSEDHGVRLWDIQKKRLIHTWKAHKDAVRGVAFGPDGSTLVSGSQEGAVHLRKLTHPTSVRHLKGARHAIHAVAFSPDGLWIAAGTHRTIYLWDAKTGRYKPPLIKHASWVRSLAFGPDSNVLASASDDGLVHLWQLADGALLETWAGHQTPVFSVNHIRKNEWISSGQNGQIRLWQRGNATSSWTLEAKANGDWLSCRTQDTRCWHHGDGIQHPKTANEVLGIHAYFGPNSILPSWLETTLIVVTLITLTVLVWAMIIRPLGRRRAKLAAAWRHYARLLGTQFYPPSPARFAHHLGGTLDPSAPKGKNAACIRLPDAFPLAITHFFYIRITSEQPLDQLPTFSDHTWHPTNTSEEAPPILLLVGAPPAMQNKLRTMALDPERLWVVPDNGEMTRLLLSPQPHQIFARLLASHLDPILISPYQTDAPIQTPSLFFGRTPLMNTLLKQDARNPLVIGGQKMGKTSLIQALIRHCRQNPTMPCFLFTPEQEAPLSYTGTLITTARKGKNKKKISLEHLLNDWMNAPAIPKTEPHTTRRIVLIDDADALILAETESHFTHLNHMRHLNEENHCLFILAGSWGAQRVLHSAQATTLHDLLDIHLLDPMEAAASWDMVREHMTWMDRTWDSGICLALIQASSGRPDWGMALCHEILRNLGPKDKKILPTHLDITLTSQEVTTLFQAWPSRLSQQTEENRQDRILVYSTVDREHFTPSELLPTFQKTYPAFFTPKQNPQGNRQPLAQIQQALDRLKLACVLQKIDGRYFYPSKLLRKIILQHDSGKRLKAALQEKA